MPAANRALFDRLGLRQGDILTRLNGVDVGSFDNVLEVYRVLNSAETAEITLLREGREELMRVDLKG
jgi:type II secretory pathway component PulC